jgi:hypothetical protein
MVWTGKSCWLAASFFVACFCAAPLQQFYPDAYYEEDKIYENKPLRFVMQFQGNWLMFTDPRDMDKGSRALARAFARSGYELLFVGATVEGMHGTRGIAVNLNEPVQEYAEQIRRLNAADVQNDKGLVPMIAGRIPLVKWIYDKAEFRFAEFFLNIGTYDIRIAFWSKHELFEKFLPVYEDMISSIEVRGL